MWIISLSWDRDKLYRHTCGKDFSIPHIFKISEADENPRVRIICVQAKFEKSDVLKSGIFEDLRFRICV